MRWPAPGFSPGMRRVVDVGCRWSCFGIVRAFKKKKVETEYLERLRCDLLDENVEPVSTLLPETIIQRCDSEKTRYYCGTVSFTLACAREGLPLNLRNNDKSTENEIVVGAVFGRRDSSVAPGRPCACGRAQWNDSLTWLKTCVRWLEFACTRRDIKLRLNRSCWRTCSIHFLFLSTRFFLLAPLQGFVCIYVCIFFFIETLECK